MNITLSEAGAVSSLVSPVAIAIGGVWFLADLNKDVEALQSGNDDIEITLRDINSFMRQHISETNERVNATIDYTNSRVDSVHDRIDEAIHREYFITEHHSSDGDDTYNP